MQYEYQVGEAVPRDQLKELESILNKWGQNGYRLVRFVPVAAPGSNLNLPAENIAPVMEKEVEEEKPGKAITEAILKRQISKH